MYKYPEFGARFSGGPRCGVGHDLDCQECDEKWHAQRPRGIPFVTFVLNVLERVLPS